MKRPLVPSRVFNEYGFLSGIAFSRAMTVNDIKRISDDFAEAAWRLKRGVFDVYLIDG